MGKAFVIIVCALGTLVAAVSTGTNEETADLVFGEMDLFTLDPARMTYQHDSRIARCIYEGLVRWDPKTFDIRPAAAHSWELSDDKKTYTFRIRPEAKWSNGDPVTAHDFAYGFRRAITPETAGNYVSTFGFHVRGAKDFYTWRNAQLQAYAQRPKTQRSAAEAQKLLDETIQRFNSTVGVRAADDHTLIIQLHRPMPYFLDICCYPMYAPTHEPTVEAFVRLNPDTGRIEQQHGWTKPGVIVGNGPYVLTQWRFKRDLRLDRNHHYHDQTLAKPDSIKMVCYEDFNTAALAFQTGSLDYVDALVDYLPAMMEQVEKGERDDLHVYPAFGTYYWTFNCRPKLPSGEHNPFADKRVRRAFAMAVDKDAMATSVFRKKEPPAYTIVPPGSIPGYDKDQTIRGVRHDTKAAKELLIAAGWEDTNGDGVPENRQGKPFPTIELLCSGNMSTGHVPIALAMQGMWENAFGVRCSVLTKETKAYSDARRKGNYTMARGGWYGDYGDPTTFLLLMKSGDGNNHAGFQDPHYDRLLEHAENATDPKARLAILADAERYAVQDAVPLLPIYQYTESVFFDPAVLKRYSYHPRSAVHLWDLEVTR